MRSDYILYLQVVSVLTGRFRKENVILGISGTMLKAVSSVLYAINIFRNAGLSQTQSVLKITRKILL
jgi:hypothetical protein